MTDVAYLCRNFGSAHAVKSTSADLIGDPPGRG